MESAAPLTTIRKGESMFSSGGFWMFLAWGLGGVFCMVFFLKKAFTNWKHGQSFTTFRIFFNGFDENGEDTLDDNWVHKLPMHRWANPLLTTNIMKVTPFRTIIEHNFNVGGEDGCTKKTKPYPYMDATDKKNKFFCTRPDITFAAGMTRCNAEFTLDKMFAKNISMPAPEILNDTSYLMFRKNQFLLEKHSELPYFIFGTRTYLFYFAMPDRVMHAKQVADCVFNGEPMINSTGTTPRAQRLRVLEAQGLIAKNQEYIYHWDNTAKAKYDFDASLTDAPMTDLMTCTGSGCDTVEAMADKTKCTCSYKTNYVELGNKMITVANGLQQKLGKFANTLKNHLLFHLIFVAALCFTDPAPWAFGIFINVYFMRFTISFAMFWLLKQFRSVATISKEFCSISASAGVREYIPTFKCDTQLGWGNFTGAFLIVCLFLACWLQRRRGSHKGKVLVDEETFKKPAYPWMKRAMVFNSNQTLGFVFFWFLAFLCTVSMIFIRRFGYKNWLKIDIWVIQGLKTPGTIWHFIDTYTAKWIRIIPQMIMVMPFGPHGTALSIVVNWFLTMYFSGVSKFDRGILQTVPHKHKGAWHGKWFFFQIIECLPFQALVQTLRLPFPGGRDGLNYTQLFLCRAPRYVYIFILLNYIEKLNSTSNRIFFQLARWCCIYIFVCAAGSVVIIRSVCWPTRDAYSETNILLRNKRAHAQMFPQMFTLKYPSTEGKSAKPKLVRDYRDCCLPNSFPFQFPTEAADKMKEITGETDYEKHYVNDLQQFSDWSLRGQNMENNFWPSTYFTDIAITLFYLNVQTISTLALGDVPPSNTRERMVALVYIFGAVIFVNTKVYNTLSAFYASSAQGKAELLKGAVAPLFVSTDKSHLSRLSRTQDLVSYSWDIWHGDHLFSIHSEALDCMPRSIKQQLKFECVKKILEIKNSQILKKMDLKMMMYLCEEAKYVVYKKGDKIVDTSDRVPFVYINYSGDVRRNDGNSSTDLSDADVLFEHECLFGIPPSGDYTVTSSHAQVIEIPRQHFVNVIHANKQFYKTLLEHYLNSTDEDIKRSVSKIRHDLNNLDSMAENARIGMHEEIDSLPRVSVLIQHLQQEHHPESFSEALLNSAESVYQSVTELLHYHDGNVARREYCNTGSYSRTLSRVPKDLVAENDKQKERESRMFKTQIGNNNNEAADSSAKNATSGGFMPTDPIAILWNNVFSVHCFFQFIFITSQFAFANKSEEHNIGFFLTNYILIDIPVWINIFMTIKTACYNDAHELVFDTKLALKQYGEATYKAMIIGAIPWEWIIMILTKSDLAAWFYAARLIKCWYAYLSATQFLNQQANGLSKSPWLSFASLMFPLLCFIQVTACISYYVACPKGYCEMGNWAWMEFADYEDGIVRNPMGRWIRTVYWKFKIYSLFNHAAIPPYASMDRAILCFEMIGGSFMVCAITALVSVNILMKLTVGLMYNAKSHYQNAAKKLGSLKCWERVKETHHLVYNRYSGIIAPGQSSCMDALSTLDQVLIQHSKVESMSNYLHIFDGLPVSLKTHLAQVCEEYEYAVGQQITSAGISNERFYVIVTGVCEVSDGSGKVLGLLEPGQSINFLEFVADTTSKYTVSMKTSGQLMSWKRDAMDGVLADYPTWNFLNDMKDAAGKAVSSLSISQHNLPKERSCPLAGSLWDPESSTHFKYQIIQQLRIVLHLSLACAMYGFIGGSPKAKVLLFLFDILALLDIFVNTKVMRKSPKSNVWMTDPAANMEVYKASGLIYDCVASALPLLSHVPALNNIGFGLIRLLQMRHTRSFYKYIEGTISLSGFYVVCYWVSYQLVLTNLGASILFKIIQRSTADETTTTIQMYGSDVHILTNSWFGNAFASYKAAEGFTLSNLDNHDNAEVNIWVVGLYFLSDCLAGVGAGHIYPMSTIEQIVEVIMQLAGFTLTLTIAANITAAKSFMDGDKTEFLERYYNVKQFLEFFCHEVPSEITDRVKAAFQATWKNGTGTFQSHLFSGLSPALAKDVSVELYQGKIKHNFSSNEDLENVCKNAHVLATAANSMVVNCNALCEYGYFVQSGRYTIVDSTGEVKEQLSAGDHFVCGTIAEYGLRCTIDGTLLMVASEHLGGVPQNKVSANGIPATQSGGRNKVSPKLAPNQGRKTAHVEHFKISQLVCVLGLISFCINTFNLFFNVGGVSTIDPASKLAKYHRNLDVLIFLYVVISTIMCKSRSEEKSFDTQEILCLVASIPTFTPALCAVFSIIKALWIYIMTFGYQNEMQKIDGNFFLIRIIKYGGWAMVLVHLFCCYLIGHVCPSGVCNKDGMASGFVGMFNGTGHQVGSIRSQSAYTDCMYVVLEIISATGHGNVVPYTINNLLQHTLWCILGRIIIGSVLGLANDIGFNAVENSASNSFRTRSKLEHMMNKFNISGYCKKYFIGFFDASYHRTTNVDIYKCFDAHDISEEVTMDMFAGLYGPALRKLDMFKNISEAALRQICYKATSLENYFAGHLIQSKGCPVDGILVVMEGVVGVGLKSVVIKGEELYAHHFFDNSFAEYDLTALVYTQIVKLNKDKVFEILEHYPSDLQSFTTAARTHVQQSLTLLK